MSAVSLQIGQAAQVSASAIEATPTTEAPKRPVWTTSDPTIAYISQESPDGMTVKIQAAEVAGVATITYTDGNFTGTITVTVTATTPPALGVQFTISNPQPTNPVPS